MRSMVSMALLFGRLWLLHEDGKRHVLALRRDRIARQRIHVTKRSRLAMHHALSPAAVFSRSLSEPSTPDTGRVSS